MNQVKLPINTTVKIINGSGWHNHIGIIKNIIVKKYSWYDYEVEIDGNLIPFWQEELEVINESSG